MSDKKIVLLAATHLTTDIVYNCLNKEFGIDTVILEQPENKKVFIRRRIKRLGWMKVTGQISFQLLISKPLTIFSKKRVAEIIREHRLDVTAIDPAKIVNVPSVNSPQAIALLKELQPDLIIVNGTRIISKKVLAAVNCKFINTHAGITPKYRGVHGTYWALANNDAANSGVTVHFVDEGIDTGSIISQDFVTPTAKDNFSTYPLLQIAKGVGLLKQAVKDHFAGSIVLKRNEMESKLWYHPTFFEYIINRIKRNVK